MPSAKLGRKSIFRNKVKLYHGRVSAQGARVLEIRRKTLASLTGRDVSRVSDGDLIEYLGRGHKDTMDHLKLRS